MLKRFVYLHFLGIVIPEPFDKIIDEMSVFVEIDEIKSSLKIKHRKYSTSFVSEKYNKLGEHVFTIRGISKKDVYSTIDYDKKINFLREKYPITKEIKGCFYTITIILLERNGLMCNRFNYMSVLTLKT